MSRRHLFSRTRRIAMQSIGLLGGLVAARQVQASHTDTHFDEVAKHRIVYQCNDANIDYLEHILFSAGELLRKYSDDVEIVIAAFGPGLHLIARRPKRIIPMELQQRVASLAEYGVAFHACGNTMKSLNWTEQDLVPFARVVPIGVDDIMLLQEQGFAYLSW